MRRSNPVIAYCQAHISFLLGLAAVCLGLLPYIIMGTNAIVTYTDQLDGELLAYIYQARYLFSGDTIPPFMGGMPKTALTPPAPLSVLLFLSGHYYAALILMQTMGMVLGYVGLYLLALKLTKNRWAATITAVLFAYLPLLPIYGFSQFGIPLLIWFYLEMRGGQCKKAGLVYAIVFALNSSLVLIGYVVLLLLLAALIYEKIKGQKVGWLLLTWSGMLMAYVLTSWRLLAELLGMSAGGISHKSAYMFQAGDFWPLLWENFNAGRDHYVSHNIVIPIAALFVLFVYFVGRFCRRWQVPRVDAVLSKLKMMPGGEQCMLEENEKGCHCGPSAKRKMDPQSPYSGDSALKHCGMTEGVGDFALRERLVRLICLLLALNLALSLVAALWNSAPGIFLRERLSIFGTIQLTRIMWLAPPLWYLLLAVLIAFVFIPTPTAMEQLLRIINMVVILWATLLTAFLLFMAGNLKLNLQSMINPSYNVISYSDFYALDPMAAAQVYIREYSHLSPAEYRVASLGINPAAAAYGGFYTLDGYSNNYPLAYKEDFRRIIAGELDKNENNKRYFDYWGNRCYVLLAAHDSIVPKGDVVFQNLALDMAAFQEMGGRFLLSAAPIANADELMLSLIRAEPFETPDSYYCIYLYKVW